MCLHVFQELRRWKCLLSLCFLTFLTLGTSHLNAAPAVVSIEAFDVTGPWVFDNGPSIKVVYNGEVDFNSIDSKDIVIEGTSGDAIGKSIVVRSGSGFEPSFLIKYEEGTTNILSIEVIYFTDAITPDNNGDYSVKIVAGEVLGTGDPAPSIAAGEIATFEQDIELIFRHWVDGRAFLERGTQLPSLEDDGWAVDPGVDVEVMAEKNVGGFWQFANGNELISYGTPPEIGKYRFTFSEPGDYRLKVRIFDDFVEKEPWPYWIVQALGDPSRGNVRDHMMYFTISEDQNNQTRVINFSYRDANTSPSAVLDHWEDDAQFIILTTSLTVSLDVLANDTLNGETPQAGDIEIVGLSSGKGFSTQSELTTSGGATVTTDGEHIFFDLPENPVEGIHRFFYTIQETAQTKNRDFGEVYIQVVTTTVDAVSEVLYIGLERQFNKSIPIDVLNNDFILGNRDRLKIESFTQPIGDQTEFSPKIETTENKKGLTFFTNDSRYGSFQLEFEYTISDGASSTDTATVALVVYELGETPPELRTTNPAIRALSEQTENGRNLYNAADAFCSEIAYHIQARDLTTEPKALPGVVLPNFQADLPPGGTEESEAKMFKIIEEFQPGFSALLTGQGDTQTITQEMVDDVKFLMNHVLERATPELKAVIQEQAEKYNGLDDFVGKTFNQWAEMLELDTQLKTIKAFDPKLSGKGFSLRTFDVPKIKHKLWKSTGLDTESWMEVTSAMETVEEDDVILTDPAPDLSADRIFYRVTQELEESP